MGRISQTGVRRLVGGLIVAFWLVMAGVLVQRELAGRGVLTHRAGRAGMARAGERWLAIEAGGARIGTLHLAAGPGTHDGRAGSTLRLEAELRVRVLDAPSGLKVTGSLWRAPGGREGALDLDVTSGEHAVRIEGGIRDGLFRGSLHTAGATLPLRARVGEVLADDGGLLGLLPGADLAPGKELSFETLDPFTLRPAPAHARGLREEMLTLDGRQVATRVVEVTVGTGTVTAWLDDAGEVVQADVPFGLRLRRISREDALAPLETQELPELLAALKVTPAGRAPWRGARRMVVRVAGVPAAAVPGDDTQTLAAGGTSLAITVPAAVGARPGGPRDAGDALAPFLRCDALVQCGAPAIRALAATIVGGEGDPWRRALLIERWVNRNLTKRSVMALPSALDVLATREGDCTEHTVLFTALARAAGIPTRMAAGLVWSDEVEAFAYHAWPEVYVGRWVWTDPTLGQSIADATHIKLAAGGIEDWRSVALFLGRLRLDVAEVE